MVSFSAIIVLPCFSGNSGPPPSFILFILIPPESSAAVGSPSRGNKLDYSFDSLFLDLFRLLALLGFDRLDRADFPEALLIGLFICPVRATPLIFDMWVAKNEPAGGIPNTSYRISSMVTPYVCTFFYLIFGATFIKSLIKSN